jgi:7,8-dihydropterin-6-yl-methyl-4-(beta-D-ribofuranosyl)aminobenzene 5'-phosphate synthase
MTKPVRIKTLVENTVATPGLLAEHGLSFLVEFGSRQILFDTGAGAVLLANADALGIDLSRIDAIVLSHGHHDHTGGLLDVLQTARRAKAFVHPDALNPKYARLQNGSSRSIGMSPKLKAMLQRKTDLVMYTTEHTEIYPGFFVTGTIPRVTEFEDTGGAFYLDEKCLCPDLLLDDQALFFNSTQGSVVILGCAHAGMVNTLRYIQKRTNGMPIHAVIGGMHLLRASEEGTRRTVEALRACGIGYLAPAHCTGLAATATLWKAFPKKCHPCGVGTSITFEVQCGPIREVEPTHEHGSL